MDYVGSGALWSRDEERARYVIPRSFRDRWNDVQSGVCQVSSGKLEIKFHSSAP